MDNRPTDKIYKEAGQTFAGETTLKRDTKFKFIDSESEKIELMGENYQNNKQYCSYCGETDIDKYNIFKDTKSDLILLICFKCETNFNLFSKKT